MLVKIAFRNILKNKRRTLTVLVTLAAGTSALFLFMGFNSGILHQYRENTIHSRSGHGSIFKKGYYGNYFDEPWNHWMEDWKVLREDMLNIPGIKHTFPRVQFPALLSNSTVAVSGYGEGIDYEEESKFFMALKIIKGKALDSDPDGILLSVGLAKTLAAKPGDRIMIFSNTVHGSANAVDLFVTGIFETGIKFVDDSIFRIPLKHALSLLDTERVESLSVGLDENENWGEVKKFIKKNYPDRLAAFSFDEIDKVIYKNGVEFLKYQFNFIQYIILALVLIGIFTTISTTILERAREIGNLKANGESRVEVIKLLLIEGVFLGFLGTLLGIIFGLILDSIFFSKGITMPTPPGFSKAFPVFLNLTWKMAFSSVGLGIVCAIVATFLASLKTVKMPIRVAIRSN